MIYALIIFMSVLMPAYAVWLAWSAGQGGKLAFVLKLVASVSVMGFLHLLARWDWLSIYLPWLWWLLLAAGGVRSLIRVRERDWIIEPRGKLWPTTVEPVIGLALFGYAAIGLFYPGPATDLSFPLRGGSFAVGQGGNGVALNYHNANATQRYALDIGALDGFGRRADGLIPTELDKYHIDGMAVVSPCDGTVAAAVDGIPDNAIGDTNRDAPAGNHVVIACHGVEVLLAHFRNGSVVPEVGATVATGDPLGLAGNSGNSSEPHLHIHAVREGTGGAMDGEAVPLTFGGVFPVRGTVLDG